MAQLAVTISNNVSEIHFNETVLCMRLLIFANYDTSSAQKKTKSLTTLPTRGKAPQM